MSECRREGQSRQRWTRLLTVGIGLWLFAAGVLQVFHGDYVLAPPSFLVALLLLAYGARSWKRRGAVPS